VLAAVTVDLAGRVRQPSARTPGVTEIVEMPDRGHAFTIDSGLPDVARTALDFLRRHI